jgi:hypothetical protein
VKEHSDIVNTNVHLGFDDVFRLHERPRPLQTRLRDLPFSYIRLRRRGGGERVQTSRCDEHLMSFPKRSNGILAHTHILA